MNEFEAVTNSANGPIKFTYYDESALSLSTGQYDQTRQIQILSVSAHWSYRHLHNYSTIGFFRAIGVADFSVTILQARINIFIHVCYQSVRRSPSMTLSLLYVWKYNSRK